MSLNKLYNDNFYTNRNSDTERSAHIILSLLFNYYKLNSMVDFGCGVGTWLNVGKELGVKEILGIEGSWLNINHLVIPKDSFIHKDLSQKINLSKKFDLAISLEVAEHLEEQFASVFIENLTESSSVILFSAAIPGQRGSGHVNEQWPEYWINKFYKKGYLPIDLIRPKIWHNEEVKAWYKQNTLLFVKREELDKLPEIQKFFDPLKSNWSVVHPRTFLRQIEISHPRYSTLRSLISSIPEVLIKSLKNKLKILR